MNTGWTQNQYGGGYTLNLGYGLHLIVDWKRSMSRQESNEKYGFVVFGNRSKKADFENAELAKEAAERVAKKMLGDLIQKLG